MIVTVVWIMYRETCPTLNHQTVVVVVFSFTLDWSLHKEKKKICNYSAMHIAPRLS